MTTRQAKFVAAYLKSCNATQAAKAAGFSAKTAHSSGSRMLKNVEVQAALKAAQEKVIEAGVATKTDVLKEFARIALVDISKALDDSGNPLPLSQIPDDVRRAICGFDIEQKQVYGTGDDGEFSRAASSVVKLRFHSKPESLDKLAKHLGLYAKDNEQQAQKLADLVPRAAPLTKAAAEDAE